MYDFRNLSAKSLVPVRSTAATGPDIYIQGRVIVANRLGVTVDVDGAAVRFKKDGTEARAREGGYPLVLVGPEGLQAAYDYFHQQHTHLLRQELHEALLSFDTRATDQLAVQLQILLVRYIEARRAVADAIEAAEILPEGQFEDILDPDTTPTAIVPRPKSLSLDAIRAWLRT